MSLDPVLFVPSRKCLVPEDLDRLEHYLKVLGSASRLGLLSQLRTPRTIDEVELEASPAQRANARPERPISRQAVQHHMDQLVEAGLVRVREARRPGRRALYEYVTDRARLFAVTEELRRLSAVPASTRLDPTRTMGLPQRSEHAAGEGARLVLVHGAEEGRTFPLTPNRRAEPRGWVIGRASGVAVPLEYDPYVSTENAEIVRVGGSHRLLDLRTARNGTWLNWQRLDVGAETPLRTGDVIGVGRSLLLFRDD